MPIISNFASGSGGVTSFNGREGEVVPQEGDYTAQMVGARPSDWTPTAADVGAVPTARKVNGKALSEDISLSAADVSAVPTERKINGKPLNADISLSAADVGAATAAAVNGKQDKLTGTAGQVVGFDTSGNAVAQAAPESGGVGESMTGQSVQYSYGNTVTAATGSERFNDYRDRTFSNTETASAGNVATGTYSHAEGAATTASGSYSHSEGMATKSYSQASHSEGRESMASGICAHAEGYKTSATGKYSHAAGYQTIASGDYSFANGLGASAVGPCAFAIGENTYASSGSGGPQAFAAGEDTIANAFQFVIGSGNVEKPSNQGLFMVGKGTSSYRANCFRVEQAGVYASGNYNASGADYAELFEWADGNPEAEDRAGRFVTLSGDKIRLAGQEDDYILGIVSGNPSVVGDVYDDQWQGMYLYDIFGRPLWEDVEVPAETVERPDPEHPGETITEVIMPARTERRQKLNPDYDGTQQYIPRSERPEWDAVGMLGKLVAVDDGTCTVDGWAAVGVGGIATASTERTKYRVMQRLDETHVRIMIL